MNGRFLPDTNILIALFAREPGILAAMGQADDVFLSSVVLGELYYGAYKSARAEENVARVGAFAASNVVLASDADTAERYGSIKEVLRAKGRMIPENDIWIAAMALQYGLILVTRDAHFNEVPDLVIAAW